MNESILGLKILLKEKHKNVYTNYQVEITLNNR